MKQMVDDTVTLRASTTLKIVTHFASPPMRDQGLDEVRIFRQGNERRAVRHALPRALLRDAWPLELCSLTRVYMVAG